jgi:hypothetical protein
MGLEPKPPPKEKAAWMPPAGGVGGPETRSRRLRVVGQVPSLAENKNKNTTLGYNIILLNLREME